MNKKIVYLLILLPSFIISKPNWEENLEKAKQLSKNNKKPLLIDFYSESCYYCKIIERETYQSVEFSQRKKNFILGVVDGDKYPEIADEFQIEGYPTIIVLDSNGVEIGRIYGYYPKEQFISKLDQIYSRKDLVVDLKKKLETEPENYYHYFNLALYYDKAKDYKKTEEYMLKAIRYLNPNDKNYYQNKKNMLFNLAVINSKNKNYKKAYSYWNAYISWLTPNDEDYFFSMYYRALTLLYKNQNDNIINNKELYESLNAKERQMVLIDLKKVVQNLPNSFEKENAKKILFEIEN